MIYLTTVPVAHYQYCTAEDAYRIKFTFLHLRTIKKKYEKATCVYSKTFKALGFVKHMRPFSLERVYSLPHVESKGQIFGRNSRIRA